MSLRALRKLTPAPDCHRPAPPAWPTMPTRSPKRVSEMPARSGVVQCLVYIYVRQNPTLFGLFLISFGERTGYITHRNTFKASRSLYKA